jgi:hypothetical protein
VKQFGTASGIILGCVILFSTCDGLHGFPN